MIGTRVQVPSLSPSQCLSSPCSERFAPTRRCAGPGHRPHIFRARFQCRFCFERESVHVWPAQAAAACGAYAGVWGSGMR